VTLSRLSKEAGEWALGDVLCQMRKRLKKEKWRAVILVGGVLYYLVMVESGVVST
jgi:hypothetical protein